MSEYFLYAMWTLDSTVLRASVKAIKIVSHFRSMDFYFLSFKKRRLVSWLQRQHLKGLCLHANALSTLAKLDFVQYLFGQKTES